jgi:glycosyltransferase involved in cell wall biosynthesis
VNGDERIRVSLDVSSVPDRPAGAGRYVLELSRALAQRDDVQVVTVARRRDTLRWPGGDSMSCIGAAPQARPLRLAWEQLRLPGLLAGLPVDVHHSPHYTMPERARLPRVVTIHDVSFLEHPEWHERFKTPFFRRAIRIASSRAQALVAVSATTARRLDALLAPRAAVHVIPHGVDHGRYRPVPVGDTAATGRDESDRRRMGVRAPYIAFVGTLEPRKDVPSLIRAFDHLAGSHPDLTLVLAGGRGWGADAVDAAIESASHASRVHLAGYVSEDDKVALLRGARAIAYPSRDEGFGLPALEAMACGTALVTTSGTAMEEVAGDAALLVPPGDPRALALALEACLTPGPEAARRRQRGLDLAARYTWEASAAAHVEVYRSVV